MKRVLTSVLALVLLLVSTVSVCARESRDDNTFVSGDSAGYYEIGDYTGNGDVPTIDGKKQIADEFSIVERNGGNVEDGKHQVTINIPTLTGGMSGLVIMVQNPETGEWATVSAASVDFGTKDAHFDLPWVGNAVLFASTSGVADSSQGKSPATSDASTWVLFMGAAMVMCVAGSTIVKKNN